MDNLVSITQLMKEFTTSDPLDTPVILVKWLQKEQDKVRYEVLEQQKAYYNSSIAELQSELYVAKKQYEELKKRYASQCRATKIALGCTE